MANIIKRIRNWMFRGSKGARKLGENPFAERLSFINSDEEIRKCRLMEYEAWYTGDGDELLNFYTNAMIKNFNMDPIYNRNRKQYFWGSAVNEDDFKRVHSGLPRAIVDTLVNVIGAPSFSCADRKDGETLGAIIKDDCLLSAVNLRQMPLTLVEGCGCWKPIVRAGEKHPRVVYYEAQDVDFAYDGERFVGASFRDYYKDREGNDYMLVETRSVDGNASVFDYHLYKLDGRGNGDEVPLVTLPVTSGLTPSRIEGIDYPFAVPSTFFDDPLHPHMGRSIYSDKTALFDDIDQCVSQMSHTCKVSSPVVYIPEQYLARTKDGGTQMPNVYGQAYAVLHGMKDGDGNSYGQIQVTQPQLNTQQYIDQFTSLIKLALSGIISPATLGIDTVKHDDNAGATREREKVTLMTRNNVIARESHTLSVLCGQLLVLQRYIDTGIIPLDYRPDVTVKFLEFANPSFENEITTLGTAWKNGEISTMRYVDTLWGSKLTAEQKQAEADEIDRQRNSDLFAPMAYEGKNVNAGNGNADGAGDGDKAEGKAPSAVGKEQDAGDAKGGDKPTQVSKGNA
jgi:hypothetical protein